MTGVYQCAQLLVKMGLENFFFWPSLKLIFLISASYVARISGMRLWCLTKFGTFEWILYIDEILDLELNL
jgi:hypothetical protein